MILIKKRTFFYTIALLLISGCGASTANKKKATAENDEQLVNPLSKKEAERYRSIAEDFYDSSLKRTGFNGAMLVAKKGQVVFEVYNGLVRLKGSDPINASTPFHIASTTKTFTAMAVLKLAEEGKLNINDSLQKFFPQFSLHRHDGENIVKSAKWFAQLCLLSRRSKVG
jgi:CubicO group peptidase (beta-lactamase class C family)